MELRLWSDVGQTVGSAVVTVIVYAVWLAGVRVAGRRTLAKLSAFDALVTVAIGTSLATTALPQAPAVLDGVVVVATLLGLQVGVGFLRQRWPRVARLTDYEPRVVLRDGAFDHGRSPFGAQLREGDVLSELRWHGIESLDDVAVVVLEPDGRMSVLHRRRASSPAADGEVWSVS